MRNGYRHPLAGTILMVLLFALIVMFFVMTGNIASFGRALIVIFVAAAAVAAAVVMLILWALRRAGVHRLAEVRTWPQD